jgi:hypothetical protein
LQILNCRYLYRCQGTNSGKDKLPTAKHPRTYTILDFCFKKREPYGKKPSIETTAKNEKIPEKNSAAANKNCPAQKGRYDRQMGFRCQLNHKPLRATAIDNYHGIYTEEITQKLLIHCSFCIDTQGIFNCQKKTHSQ